MRRIIIDTDVGSDDALAMIMALRDPDVKVEAIITVSGNVDVLMATKNAFITLDIAGSYHPPVYIGMERPLCTEAKRAYGVHGEDGLGDMGYPDPTAYRRRNTAWMPCCASSRRTPASWSW